MTVIPITQAASRRNALRIALAGAAAVALPATPSLSSDDSDKLLRWHGQQLEREFADYGVALQAFYAVALKYPILQVRYSEDPWCEEDGAQQYRALRDLQGERWQMVSRRSDAIWAIRPETVAGLSVKARAMQIRISGIAETRAAALNLNLDPRELGYWPVARILELVADVMGVAAGGAV